MEKFPWAAERLSEHLWLVRGALGRPERHRLACRLAGEVLGRAVGLTAEPSGKPVLDAALAVSLSHRPGLTLVGLAEGGIGVDIELIPADDPLALARDHFAPAEHAWLAALPATARPRAFTWLWTAKEAVLKALGRGIALGLAEPDLSLVTSLGTSALVSYAGREYFLRWFDLGNSIAASAVETRPSPVTFSCLSGSGPDVAPPRGHAGVME